jgi:acetyl esterase/lipase
MKLPRFLKLALAAILAILLITALSIGSVWLYLHPQINRMNDIVYGERHGRNLPFDVLRPSRPNGLGILVMVSGGWKSGSAGSFQPWMAAPLLRRGYTVFAVYHLSQPEATVMEIVEDVNRAVRFIRYHAKEYGIDPQRLGVTGGSAGGHLSLMLATRGGPGHNNLTQWTGRAAPCRPWPSSIHPPTC